MFNNANLSLTRLPRASASGRVGARAADSNENDSWIRDRERQLIKSEKRPIGAASAGESRAHREVMKPSSPPPRARNPAPPETCGHDKLPYLI